MQIPDLPPGSYWLVVSENPFGELANPSTAGNIAVASAPTNHRQQLTLVRWPVHRSATARARRDDGHRHPQHGTTNSLAVTLANSDSAEVSVRRR